MSQKQRCAGIVEVTMLYIVVMITAAAAHGETLANCESAGCALDAAAAEEMSFVQLTARISGNSQDQGEAITKIAKMSAKNAQPSEVAETTASPASTTGAASGSEGTPATPPEETEAETIQRQIREANGVVPVPGAQRPDADETTVTGVPADSGRPDEPESGAEASGVTRNADDDWKSFMAGLVTNLHFIAFCILLFMVGKKFCPELYERNVQTGVAPFQPQNWAGAALSITIEEISENLGLDQGMLIEFVQMNMRILAWIGIPMIFIVGPCNWIGGGNAAGKDYLSYISMGNVQTGKSLYWMHAIMVWYVCFLVKETIFQHMGAYLIRRFAWLEQLPVPRAATVLVEGIPHEYQNDKMLKFFFSETVGASTVKSAYVVRRAHMLRSAYERKKRSKMMLASAEFVWEKNGRDPEKRPKFYFSREDQIRYWKEELEDATEDERLERDRSKEELVTLGVMNGCTGFVTFETPAEAEKAAKLRYSPDDTRWQVDMAPPPESIRWRDLEQDPTGREIWAIFGCLLLTVLFFLYLPSVIWVSQIAVFYVLSNDLAQSFWASLAPTIGLQFMVCFLPTFLISIFRLCFTLKDETFSQLYLQNAYFWFQLVFVVLVVAIGPSLLKFLESLIENPVGIFQILAQTLPQSTHFYMNFLVLAWSSHALNLTRYMTVAKYFLFKRFFEAEEAREMAEPEDQDYYGLGSRHARCTIMMSIGIIFGTLAPGINLLAFINFGFCRLFFGYLIPFAECKKPDLGGIFFVKACEHLFISCIIYVVLMTGVIWGRAGDHGPALFAFSCLFYVVMSLQRFKTEFLYQRLPYQELAPELVSEFKPKRQEGSRYVQPEWDFGK